MKEIENKIELYTKKLEDLVAQHNTINNNISFLTLQKNDLKVEIDRKQGYLQCLQDLENKEEDKKDAEKIPQE